MRQVWLIRAIFVTPYCLRILAEQGGQCYGAERFAGFGVLSGEP